MGLNDILAALYSCLPETPSSPAASLTAATSNNGGEDRISALPDDILRGVVSRLPAKDAARTAALSPRWRGLWRSTPLVLEDSHLIRPAGQWGGFEFDSSALAGAVSRVLASHPGPFRWVHISSNFMAGQEEALAKWLRLLVAKGVESLVLVNRPWPLDVALPASILRCASLRRLYLGVWHFPDTSRASAPPRGPGVFPRLQELGICHTIMQERDLEYLLACSPELKTFALILSYAAPSLVPISSSSLCCVLVWLSMPYEVDVVAAPRLQRLILQSIGTIHTTKVKIGHAPELTVLGYLETANHVLQIGNTIIKAGVTKVAPNAVVPSVKVLALKVDFGVAEEVKTLLSFLRCFPQVETLHVMSSSNKNEEEEEEEEEEQDGKDAGDGSGEQLISPKFWKEAGPIGCVESQVKKVVLDKFTVGANELGFLKFVMARAQVLKRVVLVLDPGMSPTAAKEALSKLASQVPSAKCASENVEFMGLPRPMAAWSYQIASDLSLSDPFPAEGGILVERP
ncbi:hypothetical protein CFC21_091952 [Triticum aestivum]|uniref:F-box domain-containing protein n=2 Tax=Triticum aestivum TaxID=4565 RepID=A0A9R1LHE2_WHEAT|nr:F-box/FBD/LRR-repeat protein At1g13570-like [Triticum aestivum]KAF7088881.1 hypothetical protein CFC21_091952 [Triticum aestivum]